MDCVKVALSYKIERKHLESIGGARSLMKKFSGDFILAHRT